MKSCQVRARFVILWFQGENVLTETLLKRLNKSGKVHMVPASFKGRYVIRFTVTSQNTTRADIERDWDVIRATCDELLAEEKALTGVEDEVFEAPAVADDTRLISGAGRRKREGLLSRRREYGLSLILSNVPMSPNFIIVSCQINFIVYL